jgi:hypothetical protein
MKISRIGLLTATVLGLIVVGYLGGQLFFRGPPPPGKPMIEPPNPDELQVYLTMKTIISTVNAGLTIYLLATYLEIYLRTHAEFTIGLIVFAMTLFFYAITSNPLLSVVFMFGSYGFGLFTALPELFTTAAVVVLLYLSLK